MKHSLIFILFCLSLSACNQDILTKIKELHSKLNKRYWPKDQEYVFPIKWKHQGGLFESRVHFNIADKKNKDIAAFVRDDFFKIDDINMFVTNFVLYGLIECKELNTITLDDHEISKSLQAIATFKDKNAPPGVPQFTFWPQVLINGVWSSQSTNLINSINLIPNFIPYSGDIKKMSQSFCIPADNDDSSINLALLGFLNETKSNHFEFWNSLNYRKQEYYERVLKYAYRPFGPKVISNPHGDEIDPRTYFILREFLDSKSKESNPVLILPTTWMISSDEEVEGILKMPFDSNNVDASVSANFVFGLCYQILYGEVFLTSELEQMLRDTIDLIEFTIEKALQERATLILVYYPSKYDFYWFVARIVGLLKRHHNLDSTLHGVKVRLENLMKTTGSSQIVSNGKNSSWGYYWSEFLGNYAGVERNEDTIFSTSMVINTLIDTWSTRNKSEIIFDDDVPEKIKSTIQMGVKFLMAKLEEMKELNAFFSGSMKIFNNSFPYFYPSNLALNKEGKIIDPTKMDLKDIEYGSKVLMKGYVEEAKYEEMLKLKWFSHDVPLEEADLNGLGSMNFPFWSSRAITEVMAMASLSKYLKLASSQFEEEIK